MGSGNSSPVKQARNVETEAHQDVFELRFDHIAMGGTLFVVLALLLVYWCLHRRKMKRLKRQTRQTRQTGDAPCSSCQQRWYPVMPPMMPSIMHPMMSMEMLPPRYTRNDDSARFMEINEPATRSISSATSVRMPARPPPPACLPSPSQHRAPDEAQ